MIDQLKALWKRFLSYFKKSRTIEDYPLRFKNQKVSNGKYSFGEIKPWIVQVINWWSMTGCGETKEEAFEQLKACFKSYLENYPPPRPGKKTDIWYADTYEVDGLEETAVDFFEKILKMNYYNCFISDLSSIFDFGRDENETLDKINSVYNLGLTGLGDGNIVRLLKMIRDKKNNL